MGSLNSLLNIGPNTPKPLDAKLYLYITPLVKPLISPEKKLITNKSL